MSKTSTEVKNRWNAKAYDQLSLRVKKGEKEIIKAFAESKGKSLNQFVTELIYKEMQG